MALTLGDQTIEFPYLLAPMAGITNAPFRLLMREMGAGVVVSELISATGLQYKSKKTKNLCRYFEGERPIGLQIFGEDADHLAEAAHKLELTGIDFIDLNFGCPVPKVVRRGAGAAWMKDPMALFRLLETVKKAIKIPLTIKIRTGWDSETRNAKECVQAAAEAGVAWVAIHGRTRAQGYEGLADWDFIADIKQSSKVPIIGNGDVLTAKDAIEKKKHSGCDGIMIGRGALRNPFIFKEIRELLGLESNQSIQTYWELIEKHHGYISGCYDDFYTGVQLRKFMTWFSAGMDGAAKFRNALYAISPNTDGNPQTVLEMGRAYFDQPGVQKSRSYLKEAFLKGGHG